MHYYFIYFRQSFFQESYHTFNIQDVIPAVHSVEKNSMYIFRDFRDLEVLEMYYDIFLFV